MGGDGPSNVTGCAVHTVGESSETVHTVGHEVVEDGDIDVVEFGCQCSPCVPGSGRLVGDNGSPVPRGELKVTNGTELTARLKSVEHLARAPLATVAH